MGASKPLRKPKPQNHTPDEMEVIARKVFWEEAPRLQREIYEGEIKKLRESLETHLSRVWEAIESLANAQRRTEERLSRLENVVEELAEAQKRTEERLTRLEGVVEELAKAQKRTEERLTRLEGVVEELAEAQKRTEERLTRLEGVVEELAKAQKRTEERLTRLEGVVEELAEAQKRTEERLTRLEGVVEELAEAQKRTYEEVQELKKHYRALSNIIGADLEVDAEEMLSWVLRERGYTILEQGFIEDTNGDVDVVMRVRDPEGREYWALVEAKARLRRKEYLRWVRQLNDPSYIQKLRSLGIEPPWLGYMFGLRVYRDVLSLAPEHGVGILDVHGERVRARPLSP